MGSTENFSLTFNQTQVRSDGAHSNAQSQQPANGSGGGGTVNSVGAGTNVSIGGTATNPVINVPNLAGDVTGPLATNTVALLSGVGSILQTPIAYATGGNVQVRFDLGSYAYIGLTVNASFSPSGSAGIAAGRVQTIDLTNTTGGTLTLTWNASWKLADGALPTSITAGSSYRIELRCGSTTEGSIIASWFQTGSGITHLTGDVTAGPGSGSQAATVSGINGAAVPAKAVPITNSSNQFAANLNDYNVQAYGASPSAGASANVTAINAAIADMNAAGGGRLVFPGAGTYNVNAAITTITVPCEIVGMGWEVTTIAQSAVQNIFTLNTTQPCYIHNLNLTGPGNASACQGIQVGTSVQINSSTLINNCQILTFLAGITCPNTQNQFTISNCTIGCGHCIVVGGYVTVGTGLTVGPSTGAAAIISKCNLASPAANGVLAYTANGLVVEGCQIVSCTTGVRFTFQNVAGLSDFWFYGNHVECTNGIIFDGNTNSVTNANAFNNCVIVGNEFGVSGAGIDAGTYTTNWWLKQVVITGNEFTNCPTSPYCLRLYGTYGGAVYGNFFQCNTGGVNQVTVDSSCAQIAGLPYNQYVGANSGWSDGQSHKVSDLKTVGSQKGARDFVTDATQTLTAGIGATVAGGGANVVPVFSDGTNWKIG